MYFWRIGDLKRRLVERPLTEREQLPYLLVFVVLCTAATLFPFDWSDVWDVCGRVFSLLLAAFGTLYLYRKNEGSAGSHFLQRYLAVGFVAAVRWGVAIFLVSIPIYLVLMAAGAPGEQTTPVEFFLFAAAEMILYQRIGHHIGEVAAKARHQTPATES